uniref:PICALM interacting mitotic regulator n=1 Tax=Chlorocebus sabaeus TaxID=60711 RepID=A0A0D9RVY8_CHLSB
MASRWQAVGASVRWRSLQDQEQLEDSKELQPVASHKTSATALGSLCRQFQRRLPLTAVNLNLWGDPSWKHLETPEPGQQSLQAAARSAKSALDAKYQRIQESDTKWLVETQVKARRRKRGAQKSSGSPTHSLSQKSTQLSGGAPAHSAADLWEKEHHCLSAQMGSRTHPLRRLRQESAFQSPYSLTKPLCSPSESDSDLKPVEAEQHLQKLSQELDEAIMAEERKQALSDHQNFIPKDVCASP